MAEILVVEDDPAIADLITLYLQREGHAVQQSGNGLDALSMLSVDPVPFDLVVLDLMLPGLDGRGVIRRLREHSQTPVIMLTALDDARDILGGFGLGADDYLTKPFNPAELVARCRSILRRSTPLQQTPQTLPESFQVGNIVLDSTARSVYTGGTEIELRAKEYDLLHALIMHRGQVMTRDQLLDLVWHGDFSDDSRTVDVHISRLRERLAAAGANIEIRTVRSMGYRLVAD